MQAQVLNLPNTRLLWINSYLPTDSQTANWDETDLQECLIEIERVIFTTNFTDILWCGDLNWDMSRQSKFSIMMTKFVDRLGLVSGWSHHPVDFTHMHTDNKSVSTLDHFLVTERLLPLVVRYEPIHRGDNLSRHSPIILSLKLGELPARKRVSSKVPRRPAWSRATDDDLAAYTSVLDEKLAALHIPDSSMCADPTCQDLAHKRDRDSLLLDILCSMVETSYTCIPMSGGGKTGQGRTSQGKIPG